MAQTHSIESGWGAWCWLWKFTRLKSAWGELTVTTQTALKIKNIVPYAGEKRAFEEFGCPQETWVAAPWNLVRLQSEQAAFCVG